MSAVQTLEELKAYIGEHGWTKKEFQSIDGRVCASGGLRIVVFGSASVLPGEGTQEKMLRFSAAYRCLKRASVRDDVIGTNDRVCRSTPDVFRWIDRAIALAQEDEAGMGAASRELACV